MIHGFVDYGKRGVELPKGCKDLIDVLRLGVPWVPTKIAQDPAGSMRRGGMVKGRLSEISKYVAQVFDSHAVAYSLSVRAPDDRLTFEVLRCAGKMTAAVVVEMGSERKKTVCDFIAGHGFQRPDDSIPKQFSPHLPVELFCHISPLPSEASVLSNLGADLFRQVCGLSDQSELCYFHCEIAK